MSNTEQLKNAINEYSDELVKYNVKQTKFREKN